MNNSLPIPWGPEMPWRQNKELFMDMFSIKDKKRISAIVFRFYLNTKKAGLHCCCSANWGSRIAFCSEQATPSPRRYVRIRTRTVIACTEMDIHIPRTSKCCNVLEQIWICEIPISQNKALMTPLLCLVIAHPQRHTPKAWTGLRRKDTKK